MTTLPLSVLLSLNFWIYGIDFLQLLISTPSNLIMLHLCPVLQLTHVEKALWNHLPCNISGVQPQGKSLPPYQNTPVPTVPPSQLYDRMRVQKVHMHTHDRHMFVGPNTCALLAQHQESACLARQAGTYHIPQVCYLTMNSSSCFLHAWTHLHFDHPTRGGV